MPLRCEEILDESDVLENFGLKSPPKRRLPRPFPGFDPIAQEQRKRYTLID